jgi:hypothetical protein
MNKNEVLCNIKYEQLKFDARKPEFGFSKQYTAYEKELRQIMNENDVAKYYPIKKCAKSTIDGIRKKYVSLAKAKCNVKSTKDLIISDDMKTIIVDNKVVGFLQYDNESKNGNRILIFFSDEAVNILELCLEWCLDGTFKYAPKIFYQIFTITPMYKKQALPCVFVLLEKKNYETYLETINQIRCILHNKYNVVLAHKVLILDFELAMQQALRHIELYLYEIIHIRILT